MTTAPTITDIMDRPVEVARTDYRGHDAAEWAERCTTAAVAAIIGDRPRRADGTPWTPVDGGAVLQAITGHGFGYEGMLTEAKTLRSLCKAPPAGRWYVFTAGHALALVDGVLTDTEDRGADGRRIVGLYRITERTAA